MTRFQSPAGLPSLFAWPTLPSITIVRSVAGVIRPPTLRITAASPLPRPRTWAGSTRGSTHAMTIMFPDGLIFRSAVKALAAKAALRSVRSCVSVTGSPCRAGCARGGGLWLDDGFDEAGGDVVDQTGDADSRDGGLGAQRGDVEGDCRLRVGRGLLGQVVLVDLEERREQPRL